MAAGDDERRRTFIARHAQRWDSLAGYRAAVAEDMVGSAGITVRPAPVGFRVSSALRRVLARARQRILGWDHRGNRLSAEPWRLAAQDRKSTRLNSSH